MEIKEINQTVKVGAVFKGDQIFPQWFTWEKRKYNIKNISYNWKDSQGAEQLYCFSVTDGTNNYELSFNTRRMVWKLNKVCGGV